MAKKAGSSSSVDGRVVSCLKSGDPDKLATLVTEIGTEFLRGSKSINVRDIETPVLGYFCSKGNHACAKKVVELDPQANLKYALQYSIEQGSLENVKLVLDAHQQQGHTPEDVSRAQLTGGLRMIIFAAQVGVDILREVCEHEQVGLGDYILGKQTVAKDQFIRRTPMDLCKSGDCVDYLCKRWKQDPNNGEKETECDRPRPLHNAVLRDRADVVERLVANGAHVQAQTVNGTPVTGKAIHVLCTNTIMSPKDLLTCFRCLCAHGADPAAPSLMQKKTPLTIALEKNNATAIKFLVVEAGVNCDEEKAKFAGVPIAAEVLNEAIALRSSGAKLEDMQEEGSTAKRQELDAIELFEWDEGIRSDACRLLSATHELTSQEEGSSAGGLQAKADRVARCLLGERLESDGSYPWLPFWAAAPETTRRRASRAASRNPDISSVLLHALGTSPELKSQLKVTEGKTGKVLAEHLGWDDDDVVGEETNVDLDTLSDVDAQKLDRSDRIQLLMKNASAEGSTIICARFNDAVSYPVMILAMDSSTGAVFGCLSTRVDS